LSFKRELKAESHFQKEGTLSREGFHYIDLTPAQIPWKKGESLFVVLELSDKKYAYDASSTIKVLLSNSKLPQWGKPITVNSTARLKESFYSQDKKKWLDFSSFKSKHNGQMNVPHARDDDTANIALNIYTD
jgi:hypothetical protein